MATASKKRKGATFNEIFRPMTPEEEAEYDRTHPRPQAYAQPVVDPKTGQQVVYVKAAGNGFAVAGLVLAIIGDVFGLGPAILYPIPFACGVLAIFFGILGIRRSHSDPMAGKKAMSIVAVCLGCLAMVFGGVGFSIVNKATNDLNKSLNQTQHQIDQLTTTTP